MSEGEGTTGPARDDEFSRVARAFVASFKREPASGEPVPANLCDVCEARPGRDGYCHGCALDCIDGMRHAREALRDGKTA
jgi:hypothetical protein